MRSNSVTRRGFLIGQKLVEMPKNHQFKYDILSGQKFIKMLKKVNFGGFLETETVLPDRSIFKQCEKGKRICFHLHLVDKNTLWSSGNSIASHFHIINWYLIVGLKNLEISIWEYIFPQCSIVGFFDRKTTGLLKTGLLDNWSQVVQV